MCPVCHAPNPAGERFCEHCWGAIIHPDSPVLTYQEVKEAISQRLSFLKRRKTIKTIVISLTSLIIVAALTYWSVYFYADILFKPPQGVNSDSLAGEWAMFHHDLGHSGSTDSSDTLPQGTLKWVFSTGGAIHSSPAVADGTVYVGSSDSKLYALDAATGAKRWEYKTESWVESSPIIAGGVVYFGSNDGRLYALDAKSGKKLWDFKTAYPVMSAPAVADGIVYFGADDYYIYALDALEGTKIWAFNTNSHVTSSPVVANGIVYSGSNGNFSYALHAKNGMLRLRFKSHYPGFFSPAVSGETVYFSSFNGLIYAVDGNARTKPREHEIKPIWSQLWVFGIPGIPQPPLQSGFLWSLRIGRTINSSPAVVGDTLYIGSGNNLLAVDLQEQQRLWRFATEGVIRSSPAVVDSIVYVGSEDGRLYAVDAATGEKLWDFPTGDQVTSSPAVANGTVYVGSHDGNLYAIK